MPEKPDLAAKFLKQLLEQAYDSGFEDAEKQAGLLEHQAFDNHNPYRKGD